MKKYET